MKSFIRVLIGVGAICASFAPVNAADLLPASWRGNAGTSWVQYEFLTDDPTPLPDNGFTPFGPPSLTVNQGGAAVGAVPTQVASWFTLNPPFNPNASPTDPLGYGWWHPGDGIDLYLYNNPVLNPHKEVWIQLTWASHFTGNLPGITIEHAYGTTPYITTPLVHQVIYEEIPGSVEGLKVYHDVFHIDLHPNPPWEILHIGGDIDIDGIVVDTWCAPEPATMGLLGLGALFLRRRR